MRFILIGFIAILFSSLPLYAATADKQSPPLTKEAAIKALQGIQGEVVSVSPSEVPGLYSVAMKMQGKIIPLYLDASGSYLFTGNLIRLEDRSNLTEERYRQLNPVDLSKIPLDDALTLGNPEAKQQVLVFTDPHCPFCSQLHQVLKEAVKENPDLAFKIKLLPLKPGSSRVAQTILCDKSLDELEMALSGQAIPEPTCETDAIDANLKLAQELGIRGTPTLILPNGQVAPGYRPLDELQKLIEKNTVAGK